MGQSQPGETVCERRPNSRPNSSAALQLWNTSEVAVAGNQLEIVFKRDCADPEIVVGNRLSSPVQLNEEAGVVVCGFPPRNENSNRRSCQKSAQQRLVPMLLASAKKSGLDFTQNDQRNPYLITCSQLDGKGRVALKQINQPVGVERDSYFHLVESILRCPVSIWSNSGSGVHWPDKSEKSAFWDRAVVVRANSAKIT